MAESSHDSPVGKAFRAAIDEACRFVGATAPNPSVGCALLDESGHILAVAAHHRAGQLHAEALALRQCSGRGLTHRIHSAVVTLEPCNHTGRTPPCTEALLATPVKSVWIGCADPDPNVAGGGAERLKAAGRDVFRISEFADVVPDAQRIAKDCRALIAPFRMRCREGKAWITVKQAVDGRGSMIPPVGQKTFTSVASLELAHRLRRGTDAIITGTGTIRADLPGFDVRHVEDHPARRRLLMICGRSGDLPESWLEKAALRFDVMWCASVEEAPRLLAEKGALWALVEAGPSLVRAMDERELWDDWLRIEVLPEGGERVSVRERHAVSPLSLIPGIGHEPARPALSSHLVERV
ncbi:diaminohydroxyphosphoribosylaminopyrimidine deaminase/5-amino-6-(5-phosphoribosylamino)uracil reductase [Acetobacter oeni]|nr:bifunctional diaminohydroxyphosphoribosylaminopyrimidine deaminase/5-amino-6-(5-phosphoribosylamino)uracil reductase RibD [Acetobacter oeni]MBB3884005.1 diaminohydroxyphosphoribosylaminopyrimidine deaminase/5-amino-6-(5-phosphoribosylamino)uracil reductase [Acetobacter oeni]NHO20063.1 bifunctional diaminohydroxyphosphoribosylaminopyrimidine deaminase/5-amino-6-(5-phosphoribosylamino)uracil reductase RibD [Acetobacter oeni]